MARVVQCLAELIIGSALVLDRGQNDRGLGLNQAPVHNHMQKAPSLFEKGSVVNDAAPAVATGCAAKRINQALAGAVSESSRRSMESVRPVRWSPYSQVMVHRLSGIDA